MVRRNILIFCIVVLVTIATYSTGLTEEEDDSGINLVMKDRLTKREFQDQLFDQVEASPRLARGISASRPIYRPVNAPRHVYRPVNTPRPVYKPLNARRPIHQTDSDDVQNHRTATRRSKFHPVCPCPCAAGSYNTCPADCRPKCVPCPCPCRYRDGNCPTGCRPRETCEKLWF
jgi:hypothetical protein